MLFLNHCVCVPRKKMFKFTIEWLAKILSPLYKKWRCYVNINDNININVNINVNINETLWYFYYQYKNKHSPGNNLRSSYYSMGRLTLVAYTKPETKMFLTPTCLHFNFILWILNTRLSTWDWLLLFKTSFTPACKIIVSTDLSSRYVWVCDICLDETLRNLLIVLSCTCKYPSGYYI